MKKKYYFLFCASILLAFVGCQSKQKSPGIETYYPNDTVISEGLRFNESVLYTTDGRLFITNFGSTELNPLGEEGKGYVSELTPEGIVTLIPNDGALHAPKGMAYKDGYLYIADVAAIVVYNLNNPKEPARLLVAPDGEEYLNDLLIYENYLFLTVTNTGSIYYLDIKQPKKLSDNSYKLFGNVYGANGITIHNNSMYVASYPPIDSITDKNTLWVYEKLSDPKPKQLPVPPGAYDGVAVSEDGKYLYYSEWGRGGVFRMDLNTKEITDIMPGDTIQGAADIALVKNQLYIPDLVNSKLIIKNIENNTIK